MLPPLVSDALNIQQTLTHQSVFREEAFGPIAQRTPKPPIQGHTETHFGPLQQLGWNIFVKDLTQDPLLFTISNLDSERQFPGKFDNSMIQEGNSSLQTDCHTGTIKLGKNIV